MMNEDEIKYKQHLEFLKANRDRLEKTPNETGLQPYDQRVLLKVDTVEQKTKGGVFLTDETIDKQQLKRSNATIVDMGGSCCKEWDDLIKPMVGDRVLIASYAGKVVEGFDGKPYRLINDSEIICKVTKEKAND